MKYFKAPAVLLSLVLMFSCGNTIDPDVHKKFTQAQRLYAQKNMPQAMQLFSEILEAEPGFVNARVMLGKSHYYQRNFKNAERHFREAVDEDSNSLDAKFWLAKTKSKNPKKFAEALVEINQVLEKDSSNIEAWYIRGRLLEYKKDIKGAVVSYQNALVQGQKLSLVHFRLGHIYKKAKLPVMSDKHLVKAEEMSRGDKEMLRRIQELRKVNTAK